MKCRHCQVSFHDDITEFHIGQDQDGAHLVGINHCPACNRFNVAHIWGAPQSDASGNFIRLGRVEGYEMVHPRHGDKRSAPAEVPADLRGDFEEAAELLAVSPKASAAISRRCLQSTIRAKTQIVKRTLDAEIDEVLERNLVPSDLGEQLDAVRTIGNFAAHPIKHTETGVVMDVEPGEAEWNLDVLEGLFDYWYVLPAKNAARKAAWNEKLKAAGKPELN